MATITLARNGGILEIDMDNFSNEIKTALMVHGLQQKVADACADKEAYATADAITERSNEVIAMLLAGTWAKRGGGAKVRTEDQYVQAMAKRAAEDRRKSDPKAAAAPLEKVIEAFAKAKGAAWRAEYQARQAAKATEIELDL